MSIDITFPGSLSVEARLGGFRIPTDQPVEAGGSGSAPSPFDTFLASISTCAGFFALKFCRERGIDPTGMTLSLNTVKGSGEKKLDRIILELRLPKDFPEKYRSAIERAIDLCSVKRVILDPPEFETRIV